MTAQKRNAPASKTAASQSPQKPFETATPLKPRPVLFVVLSIVLALWLIALVVMRLRTVEPPPKVHTEPAPSVQS
jgi:hypothetical protein